MAVLVKLRYSSGLTVPQAAQALGTGRSRADKYWAYAKVWLKTEISSLSPVIATNELWSLAMVRIFFLFALVCLVLAMSEMVGNAQERPNQNAQAVENLLERRSLRDPARQGEPGERKGQHTEQTVKRAKNRLVFSSDEVKNLLKENPADDKVRSLNKERGRAALIECEARLVEHRGGRSAGVIVVASSSYLTSSLLVLEPDSSTRMAILKHSLDVAKEIEKYAKLNMENGTGTLQEVAHAKYGRISFEILLEEPKAQLQPIQNDQESEDALDSPIHREGRSELRDRKPNVQHTEQAGTPIQHVKNLLKENLADDRVRSLNKERGRVALIECEARLAEFRGGRRAVVFVVASSSRLASSLLALEPDSSTRMAILKHNLDFAQEIEKYAKLNLKNGTGVKADVSRAKYERISAEILLEEPKAQLPAKQNAQVSKSVLNPLFDREGERELRNRKLNEQHTERPDKLVDNRFLPFSSDKLKDFLKEDPADDKMRSLNKARGRAALLECEARFAEYRGGRSPVVIVVASSSRLASSLLAFKHDSSTRIAILKHSLDLAQEVEKYAKLNLENGIGTLPEVAHAKYEQITAEIFMEEAKAESQAKHDSASD